MYPQQPPPPPYQPPPPRKRTSPALIVLAVLGGILVLCLGIGAVGAALTGSDSGEAQPAGTSPTPTVTGPDPVVASALAKAGIPPEPGKAAWDAYIADLNAIDPAIVGNKDEEIIIDRGRNQCSSVAEWPDDEAKLIDLTNRRFTAPSHPDGFGEEKAEKILAAVREHICPTY